MSIPSALYEQSSYIRWVSTNAIQTDPDCKHVIA